MFSDRCLSVPAPGIRKSGTRRRALVGAGVLAGMLLAAPAALAQGEVFAINLRTSNQLRQFPATAPNQMPNQIATSISTYAMDFNTAGTVLYAIRNTSDTSWDFGTINTASGAFTVIVPVTGLAALPTGMSVDPTDETFYVSTGSTLFTLDTVTGVLTTVGDFGPSAGLIIDIAIDNTGNMYGHSLSTDALYSINKATGEAAFIGATGLDANFAQGMDFDPTTNILYAAIYTSGGTGAYVQWDTSTGAVTILADTTPFNVEMEMAIRPPLLQYGACCLPDGTCIQATSGGCLAVSGTYTADGIDCAAAGCAPLPPGDFGEVEPNLGKAYANGPFVMDPGSSIHGRSTGSSTAVAGTGSADYFLVQTTPRELGIYQHRLILNTSGAVGHTGTIRGLTQSDSVINPGTDATVQTSLSTTTPPRYVQWYGFGKEEQIYYRVTGTTSTTSNYQATLETTPVPIIDLGTFYNGTITIDRPDGVTTSTDFWVYDEQLDAIPTYGNNNPGVLTRTYTPGIYYIGYTNTNFANDQPAAFDDTALTQIVMDFPSSAANSSSTLLPNLGIRLTDAFDSVSFATPKQSQFDVVWLRFTVTDQAPATGACCLPDGECTQLTANGCTVADGVFHGVGVDCATVTCALPGACCLANFACAVLSASECATAGGSYMGHGTDCTSCPQPPPGTFPELEPNDSKALANGPFIMAPGNLILGRTTGSSITVPGDTSADYFLVQTTPMELGIYEHRLVITTDGTAGHTGTIRGLGQSGGVITQGSDAIVQTSSTLTSPPRYVQWYGFGKEEQIYFRVAGTSSTTGNYAATLETTAAPVIDLGTYYHGMITIDRPVGVTTDIDFWVYDANLNAIPDFGNDEPNTLTRSYTPGVYYIGYTNNNFANDQAAASDEGRLTGNVMDFPNSAANSSTTLAAGLGIRLTDAFDSVVTPTPKNSQFNVVWLRFTVTDEVPQSGACCLPDGSCAQLTNNGCDEAGGVFSGAGVDCATVTCAQPGACCYPNFGCNVIQESACIAAGGTFQGENTVCGSCPPPPPGTFPEIEPNDTKVQAMPIMGMEHGNLILGQTTGSSTTVPGDASADYFLIQTAPAPLGIYRHTLTITTNGPEGHVGTIRGLTQSNRIINLGTDAAMQTSSATTSPPRFNQWYGFGKEEQIYYRVHGVAATTGDYFATLATTPVTVLDMPGTFLPGTITIDRPVGDDSDIDFWVYDSNLDAIPTYGNDQPNTLTREFEPGVYYIAYTNFNFANNQPAPEDDTWQIGTVVDFPNVAANSSTALRPDMGVRLTDSSAVGAVLATPKTEPFEIIWVRFVVGGGTTCPADWNNDDLVNSQDISAFITDWLASVNQGTLVADFNGDGQVNSTDISAFITAWLDAVTNGC